MEPTPAPRRMAPAEPPRPAPRTKLPAQLLRSLGSASRQLSEDVAARVQSSARTATDRLERTLTTSRSVRDSMARSAALRLRKLRPTADAQESRCVSMPVIDTSLFDNIQFHSPLLEQKKFDDGIDSAADLVNRNLDELSLFSGSSDSYMETVSNFSHDSRDCDQSHYSFGSETEQTTYDSPKTPTGTTPPEVPERRKKSVFKIDTKQTISYENWILPGEPFTPPSPRPSQSIISDFDPLISSTNKFEGVSNELLLLESFLVGDTYGKIIATDNSDEQLEDYGETDYYNPKTPPSPPERSDSLFPETDKTKAESKDGNTNWYLDEDSAVEDTKANTTVMQRFSNLLKLDGKKAKTTAKSDTVERPPVNTAVEYYGGVLTKVVYGPSGVEELFKNTQSRFCVLSDQKLLCYTDSTSQQLKESYPLDTIYSVQIVLPLNSSTNGAYSFALAASGSRGARGLVFSCASAADRRAWAQRLAEHTAGRFAPALTAEFTRCGWCYLKENVSGEWQGAWLLLARRALSYFTTRDPTVKTCDLRKTRCVASVEADAEAARCAGAGAGATLLLDCPDAALYLRFANDKELKGWRYMIRLAAHNNGTYLHHQQLTKADVPAIVDKCITYLYARGSLSCGIYRRAGSAAAVGALLARFRRDAWAVHLGGDGGGGDGGGGAGALEHDVAGVLKRFFRELPEPLLGGAVHRGLLEALAIKDESHRVAAYRACLARLGDVAAPTARRLFAHLHLVASLAAVNKMTPANLAAVWAPTLMPADVTSTALESQWSAREAAVIAELIAGFDAVWAPGAAERGREAAAARVLARLVRAPGGADAAGAAGAHPRNAGDLKCWVHEDGGLGAPAHQVTLTPSKTSNDVCLELSARLGRPAGLTLQEVVCGGALRRSLHHTEVVLEAVLRWGYWDEADRRDNRLVVRDDRPWRDVAAVADAALVTGELKYANEAARSFRTYMFEVRDGTVSCFKDKQGSQLLESWHARDVLWYCGHEAKRDPHTRWSLTFIPRQSKPKRSGDRPWFGRTLGGGVGSSRARWLAALARAEHAELLPPPVLVVM